VHFSERGTDTLGNKSALTAGVQKCLFDFDGLD
jgi:hypothetical protein